MSIELQIIYADRTCSCIVDHYIGLYEKAVGRLYPGVYRLRVIATQADLHIVSALDQTVFGTCSMVREPTYR